MASLIEQNGRIELHDSDDRIIAIFNLPSGQPPVINDATIPATNSKLTANIVGSVVAGNGPYWLCAAGNTLYSTVTNDSRIKSFDIGLPGGLPSPLGQITVGSNTGWIEKAGKYLFATDVNAGVLRSIDAHDPTTMTNPFTLTINGDGNGLQGRFGIQARGNLMVVGGPAAGASVGTAYVVDFSVPTLTAVVGQVALAGVVNIRGIVAIGVSHFAVSSRDDATVRIIDCSVPTAPVEVFKIQTTVSNTTAALQAQGRYLYVLNYGNGITGSVEVWDTGVPGFPVQCGTLVIAGGAEQAQIRGGMLYVAHRPTTAGNLTSVIDIRNPALPRLAFTITTGGDQTPGIAVANGFIYRTSSESAGSPNGVIYTIQENDDIWRRLTSMEDQLQLRPPNID